MSKSGTTDQKYFVLFECDEWKSHESMRLCGVFTEKRMRELVEEKIEDGAMELQDVPKTIAEMTPIELDIALVYGYIEEITIDEEL